MKIRYFIFAQPKSIALHNFLMSHIFPGKILVLTHVCITNQHLTFQKIPKYLRSISSSVYLLSVRPARFPFSFVPPLLRFKRDIIPDLRKFRFCPIQIIGYNLHQFEVVFMVKIKNRRIIHFNNLIIPIMESATSL